MNISRTFSLTLLLLALIFGLSACEQTPPPAATLEPTAVTPVSPTAVPAAVSPTEPAAGPSGGVLISELLPGMPGSNGTEFVELYNAGQEAVDLRGWSLAYLLNAGDEETVLYQWSDTAVADIPAYGHYLLVHEGQDVGQTPDAVFTESLFERRGGLILRDAAGELVDSLGWGENAPDTAVFGSPAPAPEPGGSLERLPGSVAGNGANSGNNAADFVAAIIPNPQNTGSEMTPLPDERLGIRLEAPESVEPGSELIYAVTVENLSSALAANALVNLPVPDYLEVVQLPENAIQTDSAVQWTVGDLPSGESAQAEFVFRSPYTYLDMFVGGYYAVADGLPRTYGPVQPVAVAGGAIPIAAARTLPGSTVTIEGTATMYTGGYFAGTTGTKFYLEDETGGIQVYVPGGMDIVTVNVGDQVRVTGGIEVYRDSLEIVPATLPDDVEVLAEATDAGLAPTPITILQNETDDSVLGKLNMLEGTAVRIDEFSFSYEIELTDEAGNTTLVYIEKETGANPELMEIGQKYRITGISEFYSTVRQIKPRFQADISEVYPPVVLVDQSADTSILPGEMLTYTVTVRNYTDQPLREVEITAQPPDGSGAVSWTEAEIAANGGRAEYQYTVIVPGNAAAPLVAEPVTVQFAGQSEPVASAPFVTYVGTAVPIGAIQGDADRSPYVGQDLTAEGLVTAVFPDLGGFWLQSITADDNPATSEGVFVLSPALPADLAIGDRVQVNGRVRELSGQTTLAPADETAVVILNAGNNPPAAVPYDPPADPAEALLYKEALEGMLVTVPGTAVVVAPSTQYGEYAFIPQKLDVSEVGRTEDVGYLLFADDGSNVAHTEATTLPYTVAKGDLISNLTGPLAYTFDNYKIEPLAQPTVTAAERPLPAFAPPGPDEITIATFNVENLFDAADPNPDDPPKPTPAQYQTRLNKVAEAILAMGAPTIIGLQEVENIGVLEDLAALAQLTEFAYQPVLIEGFDSRGIDVGFLVRGDVATVDSFDSYPGPNELTSRPPLVLTATVQLASGPQTITVINNHFLSLSAGEEATEPQRTAQAAWNVTLVDQILAADPAGQVVVLGDLNSFYQTLPIDTLQAGGLYHVFDLTPADEPLPYTYIFEGKTQALDHILMTAGLWERVTAVTPLHIDADFPLSDPADDTARHVSDHDPLLVRLSFAPR